MKDFQEQENLEKTTNERDILKNHVRENFFTIFLIQDI